jgi:integrase
LSIGEVARVIQQGQVFKLKAVCADGEPLWAYRYRVAGRGSARLQEGGFSSRADAQRALRNKLARLLPGGRSATLTLAEWVAEFLDTHQGERVTVAKLRWLLGKATAELGDVRLAELSPEQVCAWRLTVPEWHRFEATQALRQVLNRAVAWKLIDDNPAKHGVPNPRRRCREQRPFDSWAQIRSVADRLGPMFGPMVVFAAATGLRPSDCLRSSSDLDRAAGVVQVRRAFANGRVKQTKTRLSRRALPLQAIALEALDQLPLRGDSRLLFPNTRGGHLDFRNFNRRRWKPVQKTSWDRAAARPLRPALERAVDTGPQGRKDAPRHGFQAARKAFPAGGGRSVDVGIRNGYDQTQEKSLISSDFLKPSDGLEPSTPSL